MYYVDNNQDYRDADHPHTFVFLNPATMQPQLMQPQMSPQMSPQMMQPQMMYPQMMPQLAPQAPSLPNVSASPIGVPGAFINPPNPSGAQLLPMADEVAGLTGGAGGFGGAGFGGGGGGGATEESYIENILRFNRGKIATIYMTFENNTQWNARVFRGRVETAGRDHVILSDPQSGKRYLLLMINLDWVEFDEPLAYIPPTIPAGIQLTTGGGAPAAGAAVGTGPGTVGNTVVGAGPGTAGSRDEA